MAFDVVVRTFFTDSGLSAGLATANERLRQLARSGPAAGAGVRAIEQGVRGLAFQAISLPGPLGRVAGGLLQLGGGNALMLAVVAGLGAAGVAIRALTRDARENAAAQKQMTDELAKIGPHGEAMAARIRIAQLQRQLQEPTVLERAGTVGKAVLGPLLGGASLAEQRERINRELAQQQTILNRALRESGEQRGGGTLREARQDLEEARLRLRLSGHPTGEPGATEAETAEAVNRLRLEYDHLTPAQAQVIAATRRHAADLNTATDAMNAAREATEEAEIRNRMLGASEDAVTEAIKRHKAERRGIPAALAAQTAAEERRAAAHMKTANVLRTQLPAAFAAMGAAAQQGMQAVVQSALQSVATIVQALPGVTPLQSGILGFVTGLFGSLFGRRDPMPVHVTNADELRRPEGPDRVVLQIFSESTGEMLDEIEYELGRRTRLDRVIRIPRGVRLRR